MTYITGIYASEPAVYDGRCLAAASSITLFLVDKLLAGSTIGI